MQQSDYVSKSGKGVEDINMNQLLTTIGEENARKSLYCGGCGESKQMGLVVCWDCFKYDGDRKAYKYFEGTFEEWLDLL